MKQLFAAFLLVAASSVPAYTDGLLNPVFTDHAVLQRGVPIALYGQATPGAAIQVTLGTNAAGTKAGADGVWLVHLAAMPAGGPYTVQVDGDGQHAQIDDILIGDVFLCAGQSNVARTVGQSADAQTEIAAATDGMIRAITLHGSGSLAPQKTFARPASWTVASPQTVGAFSASCFYFARELRKHQNVAVGLVTAGWSGTRARGWLSEEGLRRLGHHDDELALLALYRRDPAAASAGWDKAWEAAWRVHSTAQPWKEDTSHWPLAGPNLADWGTWPSLSIPEGLAEPGVGFVGQAWLATSVQLTAEQARQTAMLNLGRVTEEEKSWVNGQGVGGAAGSVSQHPLPAGLLHAGANTITLSVFCSWKNCGLASPATARNIAFADGTQVALDQPWHFQADTDWVAPQLPWGGNHGLVQQYNGLIAPIGPYTVKAAIWYQGESDIYFARDYQQVLTGLLADWRARFGANLPFVVVQLPQYGPAPVRPVESVWSDLREAQRQAVLADSHAALVVTLDVGDARNLHPANKQEVGRRIALAMRKLAYGEPVAASGPAAVSAHRSGAHVVVKFKDVTGALAAASGPPNAFELCAKKGCRWAAAHLAGASVILEDAAGAARVRYCWGDSPVCTLSDASGLPAGPFQMDIR